MKFEGGREEICMVKMEKREATNEEGKQQQFFQKKRLVTIFIIS